MEYIFTLLNFINIYIDQNYFFSLILYFSFLLIFFTFSLPGVTVIVLASGFFFDFAIGFIINISSITIGSMIFIFFSKTIMKKLFKKSFDKYSSKFSSIIKNSSYEYLILFRLIIGPPLMVQNLCLSLIDVSKTKLFLSTIIGFTPIMFLFSYTGSYLANLTDLKKVSISNIISREFLFIIIFFIILIIIRIRMKKS